MLLVILAGILLVWLLCVLNVLVDTTAHTQMKKNVLVLWELTVTNLEQLHVTSVLQATSAQIQKVRDVLCQVLYGTPLNA